MRGCLIFLFALACCYLGWQAHAAYVSYQASMAEVRKLQDRVLFLEAEQLDNRCRIRKLEEKS